MRHTTKGLGFSAWDLSWFLSCRHKTASDALVALGRLHAPQWHDGSLDLLRARGLEHERKYVDSLRADGLSVVDLTDRPGVSVTLAEIQADVDVLVQPTLAVGPWLGRPDVLRRVAPRRYEVVDTKLAREASGAAVLQLSLYSDLLGSLQGALPERFHVVTPDPITPVHSFRLDDFAAYYRFVRARFDQALVGDPGALRAANYPDPVEACGMCPWWQTCDRRRHDDDHLSLVAGISRLQRRELQAVGVDRLEALGTLPRSWSRAAR